MPRPSAAATASTLRLAEVSPSCPLIAFNSCMVLRPTSPPEPSPPPWPLYALLRLYRNRPGLAPTLRLTGRLGRFSRLPAGEQCSTEVVALPFGLFASPTLLIHPLAQRTLRHFAASAFGAEFIQNLSQPAGRSGVLGGLSRLWWGFQLRDPRGKLANDHIAAADFLIACGDHLPQEFVRPAQLGHQLVSGCLRLSCGLVLDRLRPVQVDIEGAGAVLLRAKLAALNTLFDGSLLDAEKLGGFIYRHLRGPGLVHGPSSVRLPIRASC